MLLELINHSLSLSLFQIGLMRNGKLLDEGSPGFLLAKYRCSTIEQVFLLLSSKQDMGNSLTMDGNTIGNRDYEYNNDVTRSEV